MLLALPSLFLSILRKRRRRRRRRKEQ